MKSINWRWLWILVPLLLGLIIGLGLILSPDLNPLLYAQASLGELSFLLGAAFSVLVAVVLWLRDRNEQFQIDTIIQSAEDRRRFLRRLDHELKNPLTAILAGLANLAMTHNEDSREESLSSVQTQVDRLRRLVAELRKLSELETRPLDRGPVEMTELLEDAFLLAGEHADADARILTLSIPRAPWPLPTISGDRDLLILAVHNLLNNALKFTGPGDTIEMRAFEDGSSVVIEVADTGPGIPGEEISHVWEELYRGEGARGIPGSGLGLALVRAIVARHEGEITLRSRPGEGTVFTLRLPVGKQKIFS
ncbi:MAG: HAMP domain-containing histidine kinase [Anaerolineales bacterium]|nr:HAMP domain-containing histidine kinase [Anaerolineales bacterium]